MKKLKKLSIMLLCCLLLSAIAMPVSASAAKLNKKSLTLNVGKTYTLKASGTKGTITWTSSKKSVATVSSKGVVKAKKKGTTVITAKYGKKKLTCKVTVKQPVTSIKLNKTSATLKKGKSLTLKATVSPSNANNKAVTWSSSNKKVATVSSKGVVKAVGKGTATITAKAKDGSGKKATCKITVGTQNSTSTTKDPSSYFKTVELNTANFSQYFTYDTVNYYNLWSESDMTEVYIKCKDSDWYLVGVNNKNFAVQIDGSLEYTDNTDNSHITKNVELDSYVNEIKGTTGWNTFNWDTNDVSDLKISKIECSSAQGTLLFVNKNAVKKIKYQDTAGDIVLTRFLSFEFINEDIEQYLKKLCKKTMFSYPTLVLQSFESLK